MKFLCDIPISDNCLCDIPSCILHYYAYHEVKVPFPDCRSVVVWPHPILFGALETHSLDHLMKYNENHNLDAFVKYLRFLYLVNIHY